MTLEIFMFAGLVLLIVGVSYKLGYEISKQRMQKQMPLYRALVTQQTILSLAMMGYMKVVEEDGKLVVVPLEENQGDSDELAQSSRSEEKA